MAELVIYSYEITKLFVIKGKTETQSRSKHLISKDIIYQIKSRKNKF